MRAPRAVLLDSSVWIRYLRSGRHARLVDPLVAAGRVWLHAVVLLELFAGAQSKADAAALQLMRSAARRLDRLYCPSEDDFVLAGRMLADYASRHGSVKPREHSHDLLIAIGAARTDSVLVADNRRDMDRWADALRRRARMRVTVVSPTG